jgi:HK97 gp10 family phage protein
MGFNAGFLINTLDFDGKLGIALDKMRLEGEGRLEVMANKTVTDAQNLAPVGSEPWDVPGELKDSITAGPLQHATGADAFIVISSDAPYASFVEYGTSIMTPEPFLRPAMQQAQIEPF